MAADKKASNAEVEAETQDEIEQIMSEIEELQREMNASAPPQAVAAAPVESAMEAEPEPAAGPELAAVDASGDAEPWVEETIAQLKPAVPTSPQTSAPTLSVVPQPTSEAAPAPRKNLLDVALEEDAVSQEVAAIQAQTQQEIEEELSAMNQEERQGIPVAPQSPPPRSQPAYQASQPARARVATSGLPQLSMNVQGEMVFVLQHEASGQQVTLSFQGDAACVSLSDGTELRVPLRSRVLRRVV